MNMLADIHEVLNSLSLIEIAQGVIIIVLAAAIIAIWRKLNFLEKLFAGANYSLKTANQIAQKYAGDIKHWSKLRVKYSKDEVDRYPRPPQLANPEVAEFVLLDVEYRKFYVLYDKHSIMLLDSVHGSWLGRFNFENEGISANEFSIINFALKNGYVPAYPKKSWYSRRVRVDERYFSVDSKETSPKINATYTEILNRFNPEGNGRIFDFRVLGQNSGILDVAVSGNSKTDRLIFLDPIYGDWTKTETFESIGIDGQYRSVSSYLKSLGYKLIYPKR